MGMPSSVSAPVVVEPGVGRCPANPWAKRHYHQGAVYVEKLAWHGMMRLTFPSGKIPHAFYPKKSASHKSPSPSASRVFD